MAEAAHRSAGPVCVICRMRKTSIATRDGDGLFGILARDGFRLSIAGRGRLCLSSFGFFAVGGWTLKLLATAFAFVVSAGLLVACTSAGSVRHAGQVNPSEGGSIALAGAKLSVPPGAVSGSGQLAVTTASAPPPIQPTGSGQAALVGASAPVRFTLTGARVIKPVGITFKVRPIVLPSGVPAASRTSAVWLSFYDPAAQRWQAVASQYDPATGTVSAQVQHLSWWMAWTWDWAGIALRIRQALSAFGSGRAPAISCAGVPRVTVTSLGAPDAPLIGCAEHTESGTLTVGITNNRGLTVLVSGAPADATPGPASYTGLAAYLTDTAFRQALASRLGGAILPPSETLTYTVPLHGSPEAFTAAATMRSYLLDLALTAGQEVFGNITKPYANCVFNTVLRSQVPSPADIPELATDCLDVLAEESPALHDLAKTLGKRFSAVLSLLIFDVKALLQDYDLSIDAIRGVSGTVRISRPSLPLPDFYYAGAVLPENLYVNPAYPNRLGIDNHDWIDIQSLDAWGPDSMTMTGVLNYDNCQPDCASGQELTFPVQVVATAPQTCTVRVGELGSTTPQEAYVYSKISVNALSASPPSFLVGNSVFKVCGAGY